MQKLIYLISFVAIIIGFSGMQIPIWAELTIALVLAGVVGLSHGAIDHILAVKSIKFFHPNRTPYFIAIYLLIIGLYLCVWMVFPFFSFLFFLLYSAYHFGQADIDALAGNFPDRMLKWLQASWGLAIIGALVYFNSSEIAAITPDWLAIKIKLNLINAWGLPLLVTSFLSLLVAFVILGIKATADIQKLILTKLLHLIIIIMVFSSLPLITSFSIYFGLWHALPVLKKEYKILTKANYVNNSLEFSMLLLPFTMVSLGFIIFLILISKQHAFYNTLIAISTLALPHTILMHKFYSNETSASKE